MSTFYAPPQVHWLTTPEEFIPWVDAWRDLLHRSPTPPSPYHAPAWILGCWRSPGTRVAVGLVAEGQRLRVGWVCKCETDTGAAVLMPARLLSFTPRLASAFPACLVAIADHDAPTDLGELFDRSVRHFRWQVMFLNFLGPSVAWFETAVRNTAAARGWHIREGESSTDAFIDATGGAAGYLARRSKQFRCNQNRARNQLQALGELSAVEVARGAVPNTAIADELLEIFDRGWQRDNISGILRPEGRQFVLNLLAGMREEGLLRVYFLRLNGRAIAFEFGFVDCHAGGLYYACSRGYDEAWKKQSPGNLLSEFIIDETATADLRGINLGDIHMCSETLYKLSWLTAELPVRNLLVVRPRTSYGWLDTCYEKSSWFRRLWWKLRFGQRLRRLLAPAT
jgi:hypothetical protein